MGINAGVPPRQNSDKLKAGGRPSVEHQPLLDWGSMHLPIKLAR